MGEGGRRDGEGKGKGVVMGWKTTGCGMMIRMLNLILVEIKRDAKRKKSKQEKDDDVDWWYGSWLMGGLMVKGVVVLVIMMQ